MHELSICQSLMRQVNRVARENNASVVEKIFLQVGPLSGVEPELLKTAFPFASARTVAEKAQLVIHDRPVRVRCLTCNAETEASPNRLVCGECGDWQTELLSGDELLLERLEMCCTQSHH